MKRTLYLLISVFLFACGGGGSGGSGELAIARLQVIPATIEVGGDQLVSISLSDVTDNLNIKIRYPEAMRYVEGSALFTSKEGAVHTNPAYDLSETPSAVPTSVPGGTATPEATATPTPTPTATPTVSGTVSQNAESNYARRYLVFFLTRDAFAENKAGTLTFRLRAKDILESGRIELDVDLDDPSIANDKEFLINNPLFEKEESVNIRIRN